MAAEWRREVQERLDDYDYLMEDHDQVDPEGVILLITLGIKLGLEASAKACKEVWELDDYRDGTLPGAIKCAEIVAALDPTSILKGPQGSDDDEQR